MSTHDPNTSGVPTHDSPEYDLYDLVEEAASGEDTPRTTAPTTQEHTGTGTKNPAAAEKPTDVEGDTSDAADTHEDDSPEAGPEADQDSADEPTEAAAEEPAEESEEPTGEDEKAPARQVQPASASGLATAVAIVKAVAALVRTRLGLIVAAAMVPIWVFGGMPIPGKAPSFEEQKAAGAREGGAMAATVEADQANIARDLQAAGQWLETNGTLDGFTLRGKNVRTAAAGTTAVMSRKSGETCYMYAIAGGTIQEPMVDTTGAACTDAEIAAAQASLTQTQEQIDSAAHTDAADLFTTAANMVAFYGTSHVGPDGPSLVGFAGPLPEGLSIAANHGTHLQVEYRTPTVCVTGTIAADGTVSETTSC